MLKLVLAATVISLKKWTLTLMYFQELVLICIYPLTTWSQYVLNNVPCDSCAALRFYSVCKWLFFSHILSSNDCPKHFFQHFGCNLWGRALQQTGMFLNVPGKKVDLYFCNYRASEQLKTNASLKMTVLYYLRVASSFSIVNREFTRVRLRRRHQE